MKRINLPIILVTLCLAAAPLWAQYDVHQPGIPDVDKSPLPPNPGDNSCWQASAANLLGGGGWGDADTIYGHMTSHFGTAHEGKVELATNWWLYNYGYNPDAGAWYQPQNTYNDATVVSKLLDHADYDYLLGKVATGNYVAVSWQFSPDGLTEFNHALTLVGGNYSTFSPAQSVWHDSDRDVNGTDDDVYNNCFGGAPGPGMGNWQIDYTSSCQFSSAQKYVMLSAGLQKPDSAMSNYDAAYFRDVDPEGIEFRNWRTAGENDYGVPLWDPEGQGDYTRLLVPNEHIPDMEKRVYLLVDFKNGVYDPQNAPTIMLEALDSTTQETVQFVPTLDFSAGSGQVLYTWELDFQPNEEYLVFSSTDFYHLTGDVKDFNIATECIPEPATLGLLALGGVALIRRRRAA